MNIRQILIILTFIPLCAFTAAPAVEKGDLPDMERFLPDTADCPWAKPEEGPTLAEGQELFKIINGGAELYIGHGYKQALFQEYPMDSTGVINIEIYHMPSREKATALFKDKGGEKGNAVEAGEAAVLEEYYCMFRQGQYLVTITASKSSDQMNKLLQQIAVNMAEKILKEN